MISAIATWCQSWAYHSISGYRFSHLIEDSTHAGVVAAYRHISLDTLFAIKVYKVETQTGIRKYRQELDMLLAVQGAPNIEQLFESIEISPSLYGLVLSFSGDATMQQFIEHDLACPNQLMQRMVRGVLKALQYLEDHNFLHGDIKPDRISFDADEHVTLTDFGNAHDLNESISPSFPQPLAYTPPEAFLDTSATPAADIWSFGITIFQIATGEPLFFGEEKGTAHGRDSYFAKYLGLFHHTLGEPPAGFLARQARASVFYDVAHPPAIEGNYGTFQRLPTFTLRDRASIPTTPSQRVNELFEERAELTYPGIGNLVAQMVRWTDRITPQAALALLDTPSST